MYIPVKTPQARTLVVKASQHSKLVADDQSRYESRPHKLIAVHGNMAQMTNIQFHNAIRTCTKNELTTKHVTSFSKKIWDTAKNHTTAHATDHVIHASHCPVAQLADRFMAIGSNEIVYVVRDPSHIVHYPNVDPARDLNAFCYRIICEFVPWSHEIPS